MPGDTTTRIPYELQNVPNILHDHFVHRGRAGDKKKWEILQARSRVLDLVQESTLSQVMWQIQAGSARCVHSVQVYTYA